MTYQIRKIDSKYKNIVNKVTISYFNLNEKELDSNLIKFTVSKLFIKEISFTFSEICAKYLSLKLKQDKNLQSMINLNMLFLIKSFKRELPFEQLFEKKNVLFFLNFFEIWEENRKEMFHIFTPTICNFYNTNIVNNNSPIMFECSLFLNKRSNFHNFYETKKI